MAAAGLFHRGANAATVAKEREGPVSLELDGDPDTVAEAEKRLAA